MSELLPCPFCGGEAETLTAESMHGGNLYGVMCANCAGRSDVYDTEAEAIEAWNTRAETVTVTTGITTVTDAPQITYVPERTCEYVIEDNMNESEGMGDVWFRCTNCGTCYDYYADDWLLKMSYCPHCGAKVVSE